MDQVWIQRSRRGGEFFAVAAALGFFVSTHCFLLTEKCDCEGSPGRGGGGDIHWIDTSRLKLTGPAVGSCAVEGIDGDRSRQSLLETSRSCRSRQWEGGKGLGEKSKISVPLFSPFPLNRFVWKAALWCSDRILIRINAEALNVFMESTLAIIATRNLHYVRNWGFSFFSFFPRTVFTPRCRLKVVVFWSVICGYTRWQRFFFAASNKMSHDVLSHCKQPRWWWGRSLAPKAIRQQ